MEKRLNYAAAEIRKLTIFAMAAAGIWPYRGKHVHLAKHLPCCTKAS